MFGHVGALDYEILEGPINLRYENADQSHTLGFDPRLSNAPRAIRGSIGYRW